MNLSNGKSYDVLHPELAFVTKSTIVLARPVPGATDSIGDGINLISILHINTVDVLPAKKSSKSSS